jgi:hypothetical protein
MKTEYVPVTSFIHTANFRNLKRIFQANNTPADYYLNDYGTGVGGVRGDSIYDKTRHWQLTNTLAVALLEGFNKWAKAGLKAFASYDIRHFSLPNMDNGYESFNEQSLHIGGQLSKAQGKTLHYNITGDLGVTGNDAGEFCLDADADLNFRLFGDTVQLAANAVFHKHGHVFYYEHYHSRHFWWDQDELDDIFHSHLEGSFSLKRTRSQLRVAVDAIKELTNGSRKFEIAIVGAKVEHLSAGIGDNGRTAMKGSGMGAAFVGGGVKAVLNHRVVGMGNAASEKDDKKKEEKSVHKT